jgi:hypothetical protein
VESLRRRSLHGCGCPAGIRTVSVSWSEAWTASLLGPDRGGA